MERLGRFLAVMRWWVVVGWVVVVVVCGVTLAPRADSVLKGGGYTAAGSDSVQADAALDRHFDDSVTRNVTVVFHSDQLTVDDSDFARQVDQGASRLQGVAGVRSVKTFSSTHSPGLVSADRHTTLAVVVLTGDDTSIQRAVPTLRAALSGLTVEHYITGTPAVDTDLIDQSRDDLRASEVLTIPVILVLLLLAFRTVVSALTPLVLGVTSIVIASSGIFVMGSGLDTSIFALNVGSMLGLGLSIDYALFLVSRFREELGDRKDVTEALATTMATAGRTILFSAITVILAMLILGLITLDVPLVRSIALAVMMVAAAAAIAALTLLPAVLALLGRRVERLPVLPRRKPGGQGGFWYRFSRVVMRRAWLWLALGAALLVTLASPVRVLTLGPGESTGQTESKHGADVAKAAFGASYLSPSTIVVDTGSPNGVFQRPVLEYLDRLSQAVKADPRVQQVTSLATVLSGIPREQYLSLTPASFQASPAAGLGLVDSEHGGGMTIISVISRFPAYDAQTEALVDHLRNDVIPAAHAPARTAVHVGGPTALFLDFRSLLNARLPLVVVSVMALIFFILLMFFQSLFLPVKAMLLNLASVLATYGALVAIFQWGWGEKVLGFTSLHHISAITPITLYVVLFGLSTDYEVLMLSRVKEHYQRTKDNAESVAAGLQNTAGIITAAGLILIGTFASFSTGRVIPVKEIGIGLAIAVLIDSTVVRIVLVPATMRLAGAANWWMPSWLKRLVPEVSEGRAPVPSSVPPVPAAGGLQTLVLAAMPLQARLISSGDWSHDDMALSQGRALSIGRDPGNDVQLPGQEVSRFHARVHYTPEGWAVTDLKSTNGVWVNGARIQPEIPFLLRSMDSIAIGGFTGSVFKFQLYTPKLAATPATAKSH